MTIITHLCLLISNALSLRTDKSILFSRLVMVSLIHIFPIIYKLLNLIFKKNSELVYLISMVYFCLEVTLRLDLSIAFLIIFSLSLSGLFFFVNSELKKIYPRAFYWCVIILSTIVAVYFIYIGSNIVIYFFKIIAQVFVKILNRSFTSKTWNSVNKPSTPTPPNNNGDGNIHASPKQDEDSKKKERRDKLAKAAREKRAWVKANATPEEAKAATAKETLRSREKRARLYQNPEKHEEYKIKHASNERRRRPIRLETLKKEDPQKYRQQQDIANAKMRGKPGIKRAKLRLEDPEGYRDFLDAENLRKKKTRAKIKQDKLDKEIADKAAEELTNQLADKLLDNLNDNSD